MQMLWLYIDDIAGKGVGFFLLIELIGYMSVSFFPMALAIASLISSVMVLGNLAEHYELSSIKSAGVPLSRTIMPLAFVVFGIAVFSFFCSNNIIPVSNLKFKSRLYDIRRQKPTLNLEEGAFNDDFKGFSIRIGEKGSDNRTIRDVLIYDQSEASKGGKMTVISAASGEMYVTDDEKFFIMELTDGMQSYEPAPTGKTSSTKNAPFSRTYFQKWTKVFDLGEFEMSRTDVGLFKSHHSMMTVQQLSVAIDSIDDDKSERFRRLYEQTVRFFYPMKKTWQAQLEKERKELKEKKKGEEIVTGGVDYEKYMDKSPKKVDTKKITKKSVGKPKKQEAKGKKKISKPKKSGRQVLKQEIDKPLAEYNSFAELFEQKKRTELYDKAKSFSRTVQGQAESAKRSMERIRLSRVKHVFEMNSKFSTAAACLIFLFIGAPMGAIVRKGGFGYPLLISIIFFMVFMVITIFSKNLAERAVINASLAAWMNCIILAPFGMILTWAAMTDRKILNFDKIVFLFHRIVAFFKKKKDEEEIVTE
ncbi:MAG: lipopolysaccharide export system permease protein [Saprospiraceae bacterium]|jgi:lipopolysaccharide export system permease protein